MRIGLLSPSMPPFTAPEAAKTLARLADTNGVDSLWVPEHVVLPENYQTRYPYSDDGRMPVPADWPYPDPLAWLSFVAGVTSSVRLVTGMLVLPQRNPVVLAKEAATIDHLSGGRLELGLGLGWFREEFAAIGVDFADRAARFEEYVSVLRALWSGTESHSGLYHSFTEARCYPKPVGSIPLIMGGHSVAAARRAGRLADGFFPAVGDPVPLFEECRAAAVEAGRDPSTIDLIAEASPVTPARVERLRDIGVTRVLVYPPQVPLDELPDAFEAFAADFLRPVRQL
ncbi:TIGR03619 family F420-dependent LLM class oxidoreductase [Allokutzneria sp. NRRL B-24872]|uniref:TIGR03619 family F420-dependent LLM class oxidoreductase n=1 Tax=Allokutzneria sp. NRRL B-24872 TaxID=1137961 RepID=UPI000A3A06EC|nr:TIGR03619 family F420-dependent LLM class oxidoreductase [Allokutzneria sp. NRRL B-24872]